MVVGTLPMAVLPFFFPDPDVTFAEFRYTDAPLGGKLEQLCGLLEGGPVTVSLHELEARYARENYAEAAYFVRAGSVPEGLVRAGIMRPEDRLLLCTEDADAFEERFPAESLFFVDGPGSGAFERVSLGCAAETSVPDGNEVWLVQAVGGRELAVADVRTLATAAHARGALLAVDVSPCSSFGCRPLEAGADAGIEEFRYAEGFAEDHLCALALATRNHGRRRGGQDADRDGWRAQAVQAALERAAAACDPLSEEELARAEAALDAQPREMQTRFDNARALAEYLACHPGVPLVAYPGLKDHPDHDVAARMLRHGYGPIVDFQLPEHISPAAFLVRCGCAVDKVADVARTRLSVLDEEARYMRLIAGLNNPLDIADDLDQAHRWFRNPPEP